MSNNCLVTKLKGIVNNSDLPIFGEYAMLEVLSTGLSSSLKIKNYDESDVELACDDNGRFSNGQKSITLSGTGTLSETLSSITNKTTIFIRNIEKLEILLNAESATGTAIGWGYKDLSNLQYLSKIKKIGFRNGLSNINVFAGLTTLEWLKVDNSMCQGVLSSLGALTSLVRLSLSSTYVSGSLEDFADAQVTAGRTSGELRVYSNDFITYLNGGVPTVVPHASGQYAIITYNSSLPDGYSITIHT